MSGQPTRGVDPQSPLSLLLPRELRALLAASVFLCCTACHQQQPVKIASPPLVEVATVSQADVLTQAHPDPQRQMNMERINNSPVRGIQSCERVKP